MKKSKRSFPWLIGRSGAIKAFFVAACLFFGFFAALCMMSFLWGEKFDGLVIDPLKVSLSCSAVWVVLAFAAFVAYTVLNIIREGVGSYDLRGKIVRNASSSKPCGGVCDASARSEDAGTAEKELAAFFMTACLTPQEVFTRIDDRVKTYTRSLRAESQFVIRVPQQLGNLPVVVPLVFHPRGDYPESLELQSEKTGIDCLNIQETQACVTKVLAIVLPEIFANAENQDMRSELLEYLGFVGVLDAECVKRRRERCQQLINKARSALPRGGNSVSRRFALVKGLLYLMVDSFPVCVVLPKQLSDNGNVGISVESGGLVDSSHAYNVVKLTLTRRVPLVNTEASGPKFGRVDKLLARFVKRPSTFFYGLGNADRAQSYHLETTGPDGTFCSLAKLKRRDAEGAKKANRPMADFALAQNRLAQRHFWFCTQNGSGFSHWYLMFRHSPRRLDAYHILLVAMAMEAFALWSYAYVSFFSSGAAGSAPSATMSGVISIFIGITSVVAVWVSRSNNFGRGGEFGAQIAALVAAVIAIVAAFGMNSVFRFEQQIWSSGVVAMIAVLLSCCLLLSARALSWILVVSSFRRCDETSVDLISSDSSGEADYDDSANISPGWMAYDNNRFAAERDDGAIRKDLDAFYRYDRDYVRHAVLGA